LLNSGVGGDDISRRDLFNVLRTEHSGEHEPVFDIGWKVENVPLLTCNDLNRLPISVWQNMQLYCMYIRSLFTT